MSKEFHIPFKPEVQVRKQHFAALNAYISARSGWMVSVPGDPDMRIQALIGSPLPDQLRDAGYAVTEIGRSQRILPHAIVEEPVTDANGSRWPLPEGPTQPATRRITHAGIAIVAEFDVRAPAVSNDQLTMVASSRGDATSP